jgi:hypothetical protein
MARGSPAHAGRRAANAATSSHSRTVPDSRWITTYPLNGEFSDLTAQFEFSWRAPNTLAARLHDLHVL